jgi:hypothetical protein
VFGRRFHGLGERACRCRDGAAWMIGLREAFKGHLRLARLPIPDDGYLDELLREMAEWHDLPLAEGSA